VTDADGTAETLWISPKIVRTGFSLTVEPVGEFVAGRPCVLSVKAVDRAAGTPAMGALRLDPGGEVVVDGRGRATVTVVPGEETEKLVVKAFFNRKPAGTFEFPVVVRETGRLTLIPARRVLRVGEELALELLGEDGPAVLDVYRDAVLVRSLTGRLEEGRGGLRLPLTGDLAGVLLLHARRPGETAGCRVRVLVRRSDGLSVAAAPERSVHAPGEVAHVNVAVRDAAGNPRAAVLGYWGVDAAVQALAPMPDGNEASFSLEPERSSRAMLDLVWAVHQTEGDVIRRALGPLWYDDEKWSSDLEHSDSNPGLIRDAADRRTRAEVKALTRLRDAYLAVWNDIPVSSLLTAASLRQHLRTLVRGGRLSPEALLDAWGTPFDLREPGTGVFRWRSAGPELRCGDGDEVVRVWWSADLWEWMPPRVTHFYRLCRMHRRRDGDEALADLAPFHGQILDPVRHRHGIGIGGGSGTSFSSRRDRRHLRFDDGTDPVRSDFPSTLCFIPEAITGPDGRARLAIPLADTITDWHLRLVASDADGAVGIARTTIPVRKTLHLEPLLPGRLTVGDRFDLPVSVRNDSDETLTARVAIETDTGLVVEGVASAEVTVEPGRTGVHRFALRADAVGEAAVRLLATAGERRDATEHRLTIRPFAERVVESCGGVPEKNSPWRPELPTEGVGRVTLDLYPGLASEALAGFDGLFRQPHGCFEQTSSTLYPMILADRYLSRTKQAKPELAARAARFIRSGLVRLRGFEVEASGGYSLWGKAPASTRLSACGLMQFAAARRHHGSMGEVVDRTVAFLASRQNEDGSWGKGPARFRTTAYVARALSQAGRRDEKAIAWLAENTVNSRDPYDLSLTVLAHLETGHESETSRRLADLVADAVGRDESGVFWMPESRTVTSASGRTAEIETTALAVKALFGDGRHQKLAQAGVERLVARRDSRGRFGTTQSTVLALQALLAAETARTVEPTEVRVVKGEEVLRTLTLPADAVERVRVDLGEIDPRGLEIRISGGAAPRATLSRTTWRPWVPEPRAPGGLALAVETPEGPVVPGQVAEITAVLTNRAEDVARQVTLEIGLPPGCAVDRRDVTGPGIARVERGSEGLVIYLGDVPGGARQTFRIPVTPRHRLAVLTAPSRAYDYYVPDEAAVHPPVPLRTD